MAYKIHYVRLFQDSDKNGKLFVNSEKYDFDGVYDTIKEAEKCLDSVVADLSRYNGVEIGYDADRHVLWAEDNIYGQESWEIIEA